MSFNTTLTLTRVCEARHTCHAGFHRALEPSDRRCRHAELQRGGYEQRSIVRWAEMWQLCQKSRDHRQPSLRAGRIQQKREEWVKEIVGDAYNNDRKGHDLPSDSTGNFPVTRCWNRSKFSLVTPLIGCHSFDTGSLPCEDQFSAKLHSEKTNQTINKTSS